MKIVFMGTPEFSVFTLDLLAKHHQIVAVYTQAPKPAGRGQKEVKSAIHNKALSLNLPVFTPKTLRDPVIQKEFISLNADCAVVIAYGLILPDAVLNAFPYGCINIHPSQLPKHRGAAPMQRTILAGDKETAMCIMKMDNGIDTGDILAMHEFPLDDEITYTKLSNKMTILGAEMLLDVLSNLDHIQPIKQQEEGASYAKKITKEEGELKWEFSSRELMLKVQALNPWPGTFINHKGEKIKILAAKNYDDKHDSQPGVIMDQDNLIIACASGAFQPLILQRPGKQALAVKDFLRGYKW